MRARSFHNTSRAVAPLLGVYQAKATDQEAAITDYFRRDWARKGFTPSHVWQNFLPGAPLTSVRRAMSNLTAAGVLVKTDEQRPGVYGRPEHVWRLRSPASRLTFNDPGLEPVTGDLPL